MFLVFDYFSVEVFGCVSLHVHIMGFMNAPEKTDLMACYAEIKSSEWTKT